MLFFDLPVTLEASVADDARFNGTAHIFVLVYLVYYYFYFSKLILIKNNT